MTVQVEDVKLTNEELLILIFDNSLRDMISKKQRLMRQAAALLAEIEKMDKDVDELKVKLEEARNTYLKGAV